MGLESMLLEKSSEEKKVNYCNSVMTGIVKKNWSKEHPGCVQVEVLMGETGKTTLEWVRVMQPYCGNGYGEFFIPEINTEVIIGFIMGDLSAPVILGCLWNKQDKIPTNKANENNSVKSIRTKGGHEIIFDETKDKEKIDIITKGKLNICLQDKEKKIVIKDSSGKNLIEVDADKGTVVLQADKKMILKAGGEAMVTLDGSGKSVKIAANQVDINGKQTLKLKGQTPILEGSMLTVKGSSSAKIQSSAVLELKGTLCKIN